MSSSEGLAIEKVEASVENDGESSAARERMKLYTWRKRAVRNHITALVAGHYI
jgi:hypothetical protein